ncbi:hypothetical protein B0H11DRAFT_2215439 [Mycena galericulata]|nr:hypothetical protein B0H11DRAFT_2215439 [Mycena galericulata]
MGQYWDIVNLDKRERISNFSDKMGCYLFRTHDGPDALAIKLFPPMRKKVFSPTSSLIDALPVRVRSTPSGILILPTEIIDMIFMLVPSLKDVICLGLTCQTLWNIGLRRMEWQVQALADENSWAGDRIICVGDYLKDGDVPDGLLTNEEIAELTHPTSETVERRDTDSNDEESAPDAPPVLASLCKLKCRYVRHTDAGLVLFKFIANILGDLAWFKDPFSQQYRAEIDIFSQLCNENAWKSELTTKWKVLRNLSRHIYVTERALSEFKENTTIAGIAPVWFGHLALIQICWSSDPSANMADEIDISRGIWAGDRFDIITEDEFIDELQNSAEPVTWTDVSEEVIKEVETIWRSDEAETEA